MAPAAGAAWQGLDAGGIFSKGGLPAPCWLLSAHLSRHCAGGWGGSVVGVAEMVAGGLGWPGKETLPAAAAERGRRASGSCGTLAVLPAHGPWGTPHAPWCACPRMPTARVGACGGVDTPLLGQGDASRSLAVAVALSLAMGRVWPGSGCSAVWLGCFTVWGSALGLSLWL